MWVNPNRLRQTAGGEFAASTPRLTTVRVTEGCISPGGFCVEDGRINEKTEAIVLGVVPSVGLRDPTGNHTSSQAYAGDRTIGTVVKASRHRSF